MSAANNSNKAGIAEQLMHDAPCGIVVTDPDGKLQYLNRTLSDWLELSAAPKVERQTISDILTVPGRLFYETHIAPMMRLQGFVREISCALDVAGGPPMPVMLSGVARIDAEGAPLRFDFTIFDARERQSYEEELRRARREAEELAAIVRSSPNPILRVDAQGFVKSWNAAAGRLLFRTRPDPIDRPITEVVPLRNSPHWFAHAVKNESQDAEAVFEAVHESGHEFEVTVAPIGTKGQPRSHQDRSVVLRDISTRKRAERHLRVMVDEMKHRVKNTLSVVTGIARQTLPRGEATTFISRIQALSKAHDALTQTNWAEVDLRELLTFTAEESGGAKRLRFEGPDVPLGPQHTTSLSMALHELATNALKYGALSTPSGYVHVQYRLEHHGREKLLKLAWQEHNGPKVVAPTREGFGTKMIKMVLAAELDADVTFDFRPEGFRCELSLPLIME